MAWRTDQILVALEDVGEQGESLPDRVEPSFADGPQVIEDNHAPVNFGDAAQRFRRDAQRTVQKTGKAGLIGRSAEARQPFLEPPDRARAPPDPPPCDQAHLAEDPQVPRLHAQDIGVEVDAVCKPLLHEHFGHAMPMEGHA